MRKVIMLVIGVTLFVTGYYQTRRQTEYVTAKSSALATPTYTTPTTVSAEMKKSPAFRFVKPS